MKPLMLQSGIYQTLFVAAVILFAVQQLPALRSTLRLRNDGGSSTQDRGSFRVVQGAVLAGVLLGYQAAIHLPGATITWHRPFVYVCGIGLIVLGSGISWFAVWQLGRYFTVVVAVRPDQPLIQSGLYRFMRHPSYSGQLLVYLGCAVSLTNWVSIPVVMVPIVASYVVRIFVEERALREQLGASYAEYMTRTFRLIPGVW